MALDFGIVAVAALGMIAGRGPAGAKVNIPCLSSLALAGLALLGLAQGVSLPEGSLRLIDPAAATTRSALLPLAPERIVGDSGPPVPLPGASLSLAPEESLHTAARLASAWALFQCVLGLGGGGAALRRFGVALSVNAAAMALFAILQSMTWQGKIYGIRPSPVADAWSTGGPFVGHNPLAAYLNLGLGMGLGSLLSGWGSPRSGSRVWAAFASGLAIVGLIASHSRSGLVAAPVAAAILAVVLRPRTRAHVVASIASVVVLATLLLCALGGSSPYRRLTTLLDGAAYEDRLEIWSAALRTWVVHPLLGTGLGSFAVAAAPAFRRDYGVVFARAENEYLDLLVEGGLLGLGLALAGLASILRSGLRSFRAAALSSDRSLVGGALFGLTALAVQSLGDFSPHLPGVAVPAVILCGHLCGLKVPAAGQLRRPGLRGSWWAMGRLVVAAVSMVVLVHDIPRARAEAWLAGSGIPSPGAGTPASIPAEVSGPTLDRMQEALEAALLNRPGWAEGHLRLGMVFLGLYRHTAAEWVGETIDDPALAARMADPLWLHATVHSAPPDAGWWGREVVKHEPVRRDLTRAARCFLEARRRCPALASAHAHLACLDYLLEDGEPTAIHAGRALRLAGSDTGLIMLSAQAAAQAGADELAARGWRSALEARESSWEDIADAAASMLSPGRILEEVLPQGGRWPIRFAGRLYADPEDEAVRVRYFKEALNRLKGDANLAAPERQHLEALAWAGLGEDPRARAAWERALTLDPVNATWRDEFVGWLCRTGDLETAHRHAVLGLRLSPGHDGLRRGVLTTAEVLARGRPAR